MAIYSLSNLPIPTGFVGAYVDQINSQGAIAGKCKEYYGRTSTMMWDGGIYKVIGPPGHWSYSTDINSSKILVGNYINDPEYTVPFYWDNNVGTIMPLNIPAQDSNGQGAVVAGINDKNQMAGHTVQYGSGPYNSCLFWPGLNNNPVSIGDPGMNSWSAGINNDGIIIGTIYNGTDPQGFYWDSSSQILTLIPDCTSCIAINDLPKPQILTAWNLNNVRVFMYDTATNTVTDLDFPGDPSSAHDINNNSEIVGETANEGAVIWKGLIRISLNHPLISDAQSKGWNLTEALSINDDGYIVGTGFFGGDQLPWRLKPHLKVAIHKIPLEYMLPHIIWPGDPYDAPKPKGWPDAFPFPLPRPSPFQLVGEAHKLQQELSLMLKVKELVINLTADKDGEVLKRMVNELVQQKTEKLHALVLHSLQEGSRQK